MYCLVVEFSDGLFIKLAGNPEEFVSEEFCGLYSLCLNLKGSLFHIFETLSFASGGERPIS